ncbi:MAG: hypothetical protein H6843_05560 [Rhodospirillaceae bacterium]|nr:hypothetical protein [Rhodospirillaceae bacterium]
MGALDAAALAVVILLVGVGVSLNALFLVVLPAAALVTAPLVAAGFWAWLAPGRGTFRLWPGTLSGVLTALAAHLAMALAVFVVLALDLGPAAQPPADLWQRIETSAVMAAGFLWVSLGVCWWITLPLGALYALVVTLYCRSRWRKIAG